MILSEHLKELRHSIFTPAPRRHMVVRVIWVQKRFFRRLINAAPTGGGAINRLKNNAKTLRSCADIGSNSTLDEFEEKDQKSDFDFSPKFV